jgi:transposase InsO family protein
MTGAHVAAALTQETQERNAFPESTTCDNGSEFSGRLVEAWGMDHNVRLCFIQPGRPVANGFIESFNGRLRDECLNVSWLRRSKAAVDPSRQLPEDVHYEGEALLRIPNLETLY